MDTVNVMGARLPIYIKNNAIVVKLFNGKEYILYQHEEVHYLEFKLDCIKLTGLNLTEQANIVYADSTVE